MKPRPPWLRQLDRCDRAIYRGEQVVCGVVFLTLIAVMAIYVLQRVFSRPQGRLSTAMLKIAGAVGQAPDPLVVHGPVSTAVNLTLGFGLALLVMRTSVGTKTWPWSKALTAALALTVTGVAAVALVLVALPNGLIWGPSAALVGMLWSGFLGASLATYEKKHLALELADKIWPQPWQRAVKGLALLLTTALCALLSVLAWYSVRAHFDTWQADPEAGTLLPTAWPRWVLLVALPIAWTLISLRFLAEGLRIVADIEPADVEPAGVEPAGAEPTGAESAGVEPAAADSDPA